MPLRGDQGSRLVIVEWIFFLLYLPILGGETNLHLSCEWLGGDHDANHPRVIPSMR